jgi:hypothetical protein
MATPTVTPVTITAMVTVMAIPMGIITAMAEPIVKVVPTAAELTVKVVPIVVEPVVRVMLMAADQKNRIT